MRILRLTLRWGLPVLLFLASFAGSYVILFPGLGDTLAKGSEHSFEEVAAKIDEGNLLETASPLERINWVLEICKQPRSGLRDAALYRAIQQLQPRDFLAAITDLPELARQLGAMDGDSRAEFLEACIERWMEVDEDGLMRWLPIARGVLNSDTWQLPKIGERDLTVIYDVLARRKPGWFFQQIQELGPKMERTAAARALMRAAVDAGLPQAEQWLESLKGGPDYLPARRTYLRQVAESDPERALSMALSEPSGSPTLAVEIVVNCSRQRPELGLALIDRLPESDRVGAARQLMEIVASQPKMDLFQWFDEQRNLYPSFLGGGSEFFPSILAERDPQKAYERLQFFPESKREQSSAMVFDAWASKDPKGLLAWMEANPETARNGAVFRFNRLAAVDPEGFSRWMSSLPTEGMKKDAQALLANRFLIDGKMEEARRVFPVDSTATSGLRDAKSFGSMLARTDPREASRWLEGLPDGEGQARAASGVIQIWSLTSAAEASRWVSNLPAGPLRDRSAAAMTQVRTQDWQTSVAWVSEIRDPVIRETAATQVFGRWNTNNPREARQWLQSLDGLSENGKRRLLQNAP